MRKSFPEDNTASISLRSIWMPCRDIYTITANGGMNNNPSIRIIKVHEIETYNKIIILKKTATFNFIVLFIITGRPTSPIPQGLYKMYLFRKMIILKVCVGKTNNKLYMVVKLMDIW